MRSKRTLACSECGSRNYTTTKSKESSSIRIEIQKFCKRCNAHTLHKETK